MTAWVIRKAAAQDADGLAQCFEAAYADHAEHLPDLPPMTGGWLEDIIRHHVWVAEIETEIIAGLVLCPDENFLKLVNIVVDPRHRGTGLGRALMDLAETEAQMQGYREMRLNTHVGMPENVRLYQHLGWEEVNRNNNTVSMRKRL